MKPSPLGLLKLTTNDLSRRMSLEVMAYEDQGGQDTGEAIVVDGERGG